MERTMLQLYSKCPVEAKYIDHPHFEKITDYLIENFGKERKETETFI
jgi:hypothetical protein